MREESNKIYYYSKKKKKKKNKKIIKFFIILKKKKRRYILYTYGYIYHFYWKIKREIIALIEKLELYFK